MEYRYKSIIISVLVRCTTRFCNRDYEIDYGEMLQAFVEAIDSDSINCFIPKIVYDEIINNCEQEEIEDLIQTFYEDCR